MAGGLAFCVETPRLRISIGTVNHLEDDRGFARRRTSSAKDWYRVRASCLGSYAGWGILTNELE